MRTRKAASLLATAGLSLMLIGAGFNATFTDNGAVTQTISVGTFAFELSSETPGAVVNGDQITFDAGTIMSSAPSSAPLSFTVTSTGNIPMVVVVTQTPLALPWSSLLVDPVDPVTLNQGQSHTYAAGLAWAELSNDELGDEVSITYTVTAAEAP